MLFVVIHDRAFPRGLACFVTIWLNNHVVTKQEAHQFDSEQLDAIFSALADPIRRAIIARLTQGDANVAELAEPFDVSQPAISKHLKVLERSGLITRHRFATARYCHLEVDVLKATNIWIEQYRRYWEASYDRLDELLKTQGKPKAALRKTSVAENTNKKRNKK
jgi:DNA-binding transcriptional ArsR family regulator